MRLAALLTALMAIILMALLPGRLFAEGIPAQLVHPLAEEVEASAHTEARSRRVVLGALEKVNQVLEPEKHVTVRGTRHTATYYLPEARRTDEVSEYYRERLERLGQMLFSCEGRTCGSSNYWANRIMERAILYGPEQHQHYHVAKLKGGNGYLLVYIGQRATRQIYAHVERIDVLGVAGAAGAATSVEVLAALQTHGRFVVDGTEVSDGAAREIAAALVALGRTVVIVAHDAQGPGESLAGSISRTERLAVAIGQKLAAATAERISIDVRGIGPLGPSELYGDARIEFLAFDR